MARGEQGGEPDGRSSRLKGSGTPMARGSGAHPHRSPRPDLGAGRLYPRSVAADRQVRRSVLHLRPSRRAADR
jgi:hypothetical protein